MEDENELFRPTVRLRRSRSGFRGDAGRRRGGLQNKMTKKLQSFRACPKAAFLQVSALSQSSGAPALQPRGRQMICPCKSTVSGKSGQFPYPNLGGRCTHVHLSAVFRIRARPEPPR